MDAQRARTFFDPLPYRRFGTIDASVVPIDS
jgi:hypothetical protein